MVGRGDSHDFAQRARAVHLGRVVKVRADVGQRREVEDGAPSDALPHLRANQQRAESILAGQEVDIPMPRSFIMLLIRPLPEKNAKTMP